MVTQTITVIGIVGKFNLDQIKLICRNPGNLPVIYYSQWIDNWTLLPQLNAMLSKRSSLNQTHQYSQLQVMLSVQQLKMYKYRYHAALHEQADDLIVKFYHEIVLALQNVLPWKGKVVVIIRALGPSLHDDAIQDYLKSYKKKKLQRTKRKIEVYGTCVELEKI